MQRKEKALALFADKFNCSQAIFAAYRNVDVLDEGSALKLSTVFGGGVACTGSELCGAVSGGLLAISMQYGKSDRNEQDAVGKTYDIGKRFIADFTSKIESESCRCEAILGINISIPENLEKAREQKLFETQCVKAITVASDLLDKLL